MFNGLKRGLVLFVSFLTMFVWSVRNQKSDAIADLAMVADTWVRELTGVRSDLSPKTILSSVITGLIMGGDPFQGSRNQFGAVRAKYGYTG